MESPGPLCLGPFVLVPCPTVPCCGCISNYLSSVVSTPTDTFFTNNNTTTTKKMKGCGDAAGPAAPWGKGQRRKAQSGKTRRGSPAGSWPARGTWVPGPGPVGPSECKLPGGWGDANPRSRARSYHQSPTLTVSVRRRPRVLCPPSVATDRTNAHRLSPASMVSTHSFLPLVGDRWDDYPW